MNLSNQQAKSSPMLMENNPSPTMKATSGSLPIQTTVTKPNQPKVSKRIPISDIKDHKNYGFIAIEQSVLQKIYTQSGPLAATAEFQVDYWALVFRHKFKDNSIVDVSIPLVFFNYPQEVNGAHIDFDMTDVSELSSKLLPVAQKAASDVLATDFKKTIETIFNVTFEEMLIPLNTIHKHPGTSARQSFSPTDLLKTPDDLGVVFPWNIAEPDTPNFAGIMALDAGKNNLAHMEYRLVSGELGKDIQYREGRCIAFNISRPSYSDAELLLGKDCSNTPTAIVKSKNSNTSDEFNRSVLTAYTHLFEHFTPYTQFVINENVKKKVYPAYVNTRVQESLWQKYSKKVDTKTTDFDEIRLKPRSLEQLIKFSISTLRSILAVVAKNIAGTDYTQWQLNQKSRGEIIDELLQLYKQQVVTKPVNEQPDAKSEVSEFNCLTIAELESKSLLELKFYLRDLAEYNEEIYEIDEMVDYDKELIIDEILNYYRIMLKDAERVKRVLMTPEKLQSATVFQLKQYLFSISEFIREPIEIAALAEHTKEQLIEDIMEVYTNSPDDFTLVENIKETTNVDVMRDVLIAEVYSWEQVLALEDDAVRTWYGIKIKQ